MPFVFASAEIDSMREGKFLRISSAATCSRPCGVWMMNEVALAADKGGSRLDPQEGEIALELGIMDKVQIQQMNCVKRVSTACRKLHFELELHHQREDEK